MEHRVKVTVLEKNISRITSTILCTTDSEKCPCYNVGEEFMIDENLQGNGYGTVALQIIIKYFREHGANNIRLSTKETNTTALSMYRKAGFRDTGEMNGEEIVLQLNL